MAFASYICPAQRVQIMRTETTTKNDSASWRTRHKRGLTRRGRHRKRGAFLSRPNVERAVGAGNECWKIAVDYTDTILYELTEQQLR